jgi:sugar lactone lactonase YvrE
MSILKNIISGERSLRVLLFVSLIFFTLNLVGCGGGGGGESAGSTQLPPPPPPPVSSGPSITLFAGALGGAGNTDGLPGRLNRPISLAVDASNNIYTGDGGNCNIRKLSASGLSVFMGGRSCHIYADDGTGSSSAVKGYIIADRVGTLYLAKYEQFVTRLTRIESNGTLTELPAVIQGSPPPKLAIDTDGTIYAHDPFTGSIDSYDKSGNKNLFAGGFARSIFVDSTEALTFGDDGTLYVTDTPYGSIRKIDRAGQVTTLANAVSSHPVGIAVDTSGNVYVGDSYNQTVRKITPDGVVSTLAGSARLLGATDGKGAAARFMSVNEIAVDKSGAVIVADTENNAIRRVSPDGVVTTIGGVMPSRGSNDGAALTSRFNFPTGIARDNAGNIYLADSYNYTIRKIGSAGDTTTLAGKPGESGIQNGSSTSATFSSPVSATVDPLGNVYVVDYSRIRKISVTGDVSVFADAGLVPSGSSYFTFSNRPRFLQSVALDSQSQLYTVDTIRVAVNKVSTSGSFLPISCGEGCTPLAVAGDAAGNIFVTSRGAIRKIGANGVATVIAGVETEVPRVTFEWKDGPSSVARFSSQLNALAIDSAGNIFICDTDNHVIRKITPSGVVTTIAGKAGIAGTTLGPLPGLLNAPNGIVIDNAGNLYVTTEDAVVKITLS